MTFTTHALLVSFLLSAAPVHAGQGSDATVETVETQPQWAPDALRIGTELAGGTVGGILMAFPGTVPGVVLSRAFNEWNCGTITQPLGVCRDDLAAAGHGFFMGATFGAGLGSGLGVAISGALLHGGGNFWLTVGTGFAAGTLSLLLPDVVGLAVASVLGVVGSTIVYERTRPEPVGISAPKSAALFDLRVTPTVTAGPGGGLVGISGQF